MMSWQRNPNSKRRKAVDAATTTGWIVAIFFASPFIAYLFAHDAYNKSSWRFNRKNSIPSPSRSLRNKIGSLWHRKPNPAAQLQSRFFALPLELRQKIYHFAIDCSRIHIVHTPRRLAGYACQEPLRTASCTCYMNVVSYQDARIGCQRLPRPNAPVFINRKCPLNEILPILMTCKRMYEEAVFVLYAWRTLSFMHPTAFISLSASIPTTHFNYITSLEFVLHVQTNFSECDYVLYAPFIKQRSSPDRKFGRVCKQSGSKIDDHNPHTTMIHPKLRIPTTCGLMCQTVSRMENLKHFHMRLRDYRPTRGGPWKKADELKPSMLAITEAAGFPEECAVGLNTLKGFVWP